MLELAVKENRHLSLNHDKAPLLERLKEYSSKDIVCFDVPGHVKSNGVKILNEYFGEHIMDMDINSSPLMDNVSGAYGIIKESQELLADAYCCDKAFFITNGTTQAIHAMILSTIKPNDKIILPRNVHKSAINSLILAGGQPIFVQPEFDEELGISLNVSRNKAIEAVKKNKNIKAIMLLNPTYYGACTDLKAIIDFCHSRNIIVMVDEAHGAHFPFNCNFPKSAMELGADLSAVSIHKTGGSLTQSSALLMNRGRVCEENIQQTINMLQSTSASYLLMSSVDGARKNLMQNGENQLQNAIEISNYAREKLNSIKGIYIPQNIDKNTSGCFRKDPTKLCINVRGLNLTGIDVYNLLYKNYSIQVELGDMYNILALVSIGTKKSDIDRLYNALKDISKKYKKDITLVDIKLKPIYTTIKLSPREAYYSKKESIPLEKSMGKIAAESIMAYPPGIPIISPGELITDEIIEYIKTLKKNKAYMTDMSDKTLKTILVIKEK